MSHGMLPETVSIEIDGAVLQYLYYKGKGPVVVMMHATGFLPWMWHPIARELTDSFSLIAPYFCDHRILEPEDGGISWMLLANDLCRLCEKLGIDRPYLIGHSMGATIMTLADATHGSMARKMILIEPIFLPVDFYKTRITVDQHPLASKSIKRRNGWKDNKEVREYLRSRNLFKNWDDEMLDIYIQFGMKESENGGMQLACAPRREASLFMGGMQYNPWPLLSKVRCPVLVIEGEESENRDFIDLKKAASLFQDGRYLMVPHAGHLIPMEKPVEVLSIIRDFFR